MVIGRGRRREHPQEHFRRGSRNLRSLRVLHNFRLRTLKGTPKGSSDLGSHSVAMLLLLRKKMREKAGHPQNLLPVMAISGQGLFRSRDFVTSGQKAPLWRIWCTFRLCMRRTYFRTGHVTYVTSGHVTDVTSGHMTDVTSGSTTAQHHRKYDLSCPHILLTGVSTND